MANSCITKHCKKNHARQRRSSWNVSDGNAKNRLIFFLIKIKKKLKQRTYYCVDWLINMFYFTFNRHRVFTVQKKPWCRQRYKLYVRLLMYTRLFPSKSTSARGDQIDTLKLFFVSSSPKFFSQFVSKPNDFLHRLLT